MRDLFHRFIDNQSGLTAIEYGLIAVLIISVILHMVQAGVALVGTNVAAAFQSVAAALFPLRE